MELVQKELEVWFASIPQLGPVKRALLLDYFKNEEEIYKASMATIGKVEKITEKDAEAICASRQSEKIRKYYERMLEKEIKFISIREKEYPEKLRNIEKPPYGLFVRGKLLREDRISIAIVGARNCTPYGKEMARYFAKELSANGIQVISGLAYGIDGSAHWGALQGETPTFGVLGNGIDICYPKENFNLYMELWKNGGIFSEYGLGVPGVAFQFPMRNRIISGLSDGVLVVEARERSGSLITADFALEQGKEVFAIPGKIDDSLSRGCNNLIKNGAELVNSPEDILENFHIRSICEYRKMQVSNVKLEGKEKKVYLSLSYEPKHVNEIAMQNNILISELMGILLQLEMKGFIRQVSGNCYIQVKQ